MQFTLRSVKDADEEFLYRVYEATHGQQFALLPLAAAQRDALVRMQFEAQRMGYRQQNPASEDFIISVGDAAAGRVWLDQSRDAELFVLDIAILPEYQGQALGTAVLRALVEQAAHAGKRVRLHVARMNVGAFQFYRRLGFEVCGGDEVYLEMMSEFPSSGACAELG